MRRRGAAGLMADETTTPFDHAHPLWRRMLPALLSAGIILPAGLALNYALNVVLARVLQAAGYGLFAYAQSLATVLALAGSLGFSTSMMRFVAAYRAQDQQALLHGLVRSSLRLILLASVLLALLLLMLGQMFPNHGVGLLWAAALLVPFTVDVWRESAMRGLHRTSLAILPRQVLLPGLTLIGVAVFGLNYAIDVLLSFLALLVLLELAALWHMRRVMNFPKDGRPIAETKYWLRTSLPMAGANLALQGITRWDIVMVGVLLSLEATGSYAAAARTALLATLVLRVVNLVIGPMLADLYHSGDIRTFRKLLIAAAFGAGVAGLPLYLLVLLRPEWILGLFGQAYTDAALILQILATGQFINLITGPVGLALTMSRYESLNLSIAVIAAAISLVGLSILVPQYGVVGAAVATSAAVALRNISTAFAAFRVFRLL